VSAASPGRLTHAFAARRGRTGLIPFVTAGFPSTSATLALLEGFDRQGCLAAEIGVPFSDPIADGPEIQRASEAALRAGVGLPVVLDLVQRFRAYSTLPLVLMTYANPVFRHGVERFANDARAAGIDGLIVSDLPPEECADAWDAFDAAGLDTVMLVAPTTPAARLPRLLARCRGFVYCLARTGVTGAGGGDAGALEERVAMLRAATPLPVAIGFGIGTPDRVRALDGHADALIVGAALMRAAREGMTSGGETRAVAQALELCGSLAGALA
jgi:tryptophan synthase alpha chain